MDVEVIYKDCKKICEGSRRTPIGTNMSDELRKRLDDFCRGNRFKLGEGLDLAVYYFLTGAGSSFADFKPKEVEEKKKKEEIIAQRNPFYICKVCEGGHAYRSNLSACPKCGTPTPQADDDAPEPVQHVQEVEGDYELPPVPDLDEDYEV